MVRCRSGRRKAGGVDTALLVKQPLVDRLWWVIEPMAVALLVRRDPSHVELPSRHLRQQPIEVVEIALPGLHDGPPVPPVPRGCDSSVHTAPDALPASAIGIDASDVWRAAGATCVSTETVEATTTIIAFNYRYGHLLLASS